jgi:hypothetical protein
MGFPAGPIKAVLVAALILPLATSDIGAQDHPLSPPTTVAEKQRKPRGDRAREPATDCKPDDRKCEVERKLGGPTGDWDFFWRLKQRQKSGGR